MSPEMEMLPFWMGLASIEGEDEMEDCMSRLLNKYMKQMNLCYAKEMSRSYEDIHICKDRVLHQLHLIGLCNE